MTLSQPATRLPAPPPGPPFILNESKLAPPRARPGSVARAALLTRLEASAGTPVVTVCAPPGYGKTTVMAQWARDDPRPFAWLSVDDRDNDPAVLLTYLAIAVDRQVAVDRAVFYALAAPGSSTVEAVLPRLAAALWASSPPIVLALDDVHLLHDRACLEVLETLSEQIGGRSQLAITSRGSAPLPVARMRAEGRVVEIGLEDLRMRRPEAGTLLSRAGLAATSGEADELTRRTEGWPVALDLAARSARPGQAGLAQDGLALDAPEGQLAGYLQSMVLSRLPPRTVRFLTRTSVLDRLSGPLCDAVLATGGSSALLASLEQENLLVVPLDRHRQWYRCHHLLRELLRARLEREEPELVPELTSRAAHWSEDNGLAEAAIDYTMQAGDASHAAGLVEQLALPAYSSGQAATLLRWFAWFDAAEVPGQAAPRRIERYPSLAALGACVTALIGQPAITERWAGAAERGAATVQPTAAPVAGGMPLEGWMALLRTVLCRTGVERMHADAALTLELLPTGNPWRPTARTLLGIAELLDGDAGTAEATLTLASEEAEAAGAADSISVSLTERAILAMDRDEWDDASIMLERARTVIQAAHLDEDVTTVLLDAASARVALHHGDVRQAHADLSRAQRLRERLTSAAMPFYAVQARLQLARACVALTDVAGARIFLREVDDLIRRRPGLGTLVKQADGLRAQLDTIDAAVIGASSLTAAELRLLPALCTHHSFREIGERLHVSPHTVKSQAMSIYRKLRVSSRSEAVARARDLGFLAV